MFNNNLKRDLQRLKLRLFGSGNTDCLNVFTYDPTNSILGGHRGRIIELENKIYRIINKVNELIDLTKPTKKRKSKKKK